jgi:phytanoyl-CoA hydroxylase
MSAFFDTEGYEVFYDIVPKDEVDYLRSIYDDFLHGVYDLEGLRSDLSGDVSTEKKVEKITQIMRPSLLAAQLLETKTYQNVIHHAKSILGDDMSIDFDMMINKAPGTMTETPWHQDAAYWPKLSDTRAVSFWIALDEVDQDNGCMMYVPKTHDGKIRHHYQPNAGGALRCDVSDQETVFHGEIPTGTAIAHHGFTIHGALGNSSTDRQRRALIVNLRPQAMIDDMRSRGYDHLGNREVKNK